MHDCPLGQDAAQTPFRQQPPLHSAVVALHAVVQEKKLHAIPVGQSVAKVQPHPVVTHVPAEPQQRLEPHVPSSVPPHALTHTPAVHVGVESPHDWHALPVDPHVELPVPG